MKINQRRFAVLIWAAAIVLAGMGCSVAQTDTLSATAPAAVKPQDDKSKGAANGVPAGNPVFPSAIDPKYSHELGPLGRMRTCADQFTANKATNANGGMKWIDRSGGYYLQCSKHLKG